MTGTLERILLNTTARVFYFMIEYNSKAPLRIKHKVDEKKLHYLTSLQYYVVSDTL